SNSIFNEFDKVLLWDESQCIYFGPVGEARQYFEDLAFYCLPRKSTHDFLTGLCNPLEREIKSGFEARVPLNAQAFEQCYQESEMQQFRQTRASRSAPYTASFYQQVKAFTIRQYHLLIMDREDLLSRYGTILI
ncbi:hypothetical protein BC941DRAFT_432573, partial [Chlamydoabsidia padenii]